MTLSPFFSTKQIIQGLLILTTLTFGCRNTTILVTDKPQKEYPSIDIQLPSDTTANVYIGLKRKKSVIRFYKLRNNAPIWSDHNKLSILGDSMVSLINDARYYGLPSKNYHFSEIKQKEHFQNGIIRIEVLLTDAFLSIARDLKYGRLSTLTKANEDSLQISVLQQIVNGGGLKKKLEQQEPEFFGYRSLKEVLKWSLDTVKGEARKPLTEKGSNDSSFYKTIQSLEVNLERWRWENLPFGNRYIFVNIPSFMLQVVSEEKVVLESRIIVGAPETPTPVLSSSVDCISIYPYWYVPRKISIEEYLPVLQKDKSYIVKHNFEVLDRLGKVLNPDSIDWKKFNTNYFPVSLRQREGPDNSLGVIKFLFDNPYAVFLHDTNTKQLFDNDVRALSHGCIRMEKAVPLAHYLVTGSVKKESKTIEKYLHQEQRHTVELTHSIPIYLRYLTCEFKDHLLYQYPDIYGMDQKLIKLLNK